MIIFRLLVWSGILLTPVAGQGRKLQIQGWVADRPYLVEGKATEIRGGPEQGRLASLTVIYRPGSKVESKPESVTVTSDGTATWIPRAPGLAKLIAKIEPAGGGEPIEHEEIVSVRFETAISFGLFVMVAAGLILFGGAFLSIRALLRRPGPEA